MKLQKPKFWQNINLISIGLLPLSFITLIFIHIKNIIIKKNKFNIPIICVGNIFLGGTGKTPLSIYFYNLFTKKKKRPAIVRKYYPSHYDEINFTKSKIKNIYIENSRYAGIKKAENKKHDVIILDDGLQDISIKKKQSIACFNSDDLIGNGLLLPAGPLREPLKNLNQVKLIVINGKRNIAFEKKLKIKSPKAKIFYSTYIPKNIKKFKGKRILAFAGIGNPNGFFNMLKRHKLNIGDEISFPDHYDYNKDEILNLIRRAKKERMKLITTEKDYYRLKTLGFLKIEYISVNLKIVNEKSFCKELFKIYE